MDGSHTVNAAEAMRIKAEMYYCGLSQRYKAEIRNVWYYIAI